MSYLIFFCRDCMREWSIWSIFSGSFNMRFFLKLLSDQQFIVHYNIAPNEQNEALFLFPFVSLRFDINCEWWMEMCTKKTSTRKSIQTDVEQIKQSGTFYSRICVVDDIWCMTLWADCGWSCAGMSSKTVKIKRCPLIFDDCAIWILTNAHLVSIAFFSASQTKRSTYSWYGRNSRRCCSVLGIWTTWKWSTAVDIFVVMSGTSICGERA